MSRKTTAVIAEDEPLLAQALRAELAKAWPELEVLATVGDGASAVKKALELRPDVLFFDIRMPRMSGLEAAAELADSWPPEDAGDLPFPSLVFVTAYDQYAVQAFEAQAADYVLKPVQPERLQKTVARVQQTLATRNPAAASQALDDTVAQLRALLGGMNVGGSNALQVTAAPVAPLQVIQASVGSSIRMVPLTDVIYFEAADKYVRVLTAGHEYLIRTPLKDLLPQLDANVFWQIHRGTVVRASAIDAVHRDEAGKLSLSLRGHVDKLSVSRLYAHLFRAM
jgi:DNA-binding LytR/AlgR family response regulator